MASEDARDVRGVCSVVADGVEAWQVVAGAGEERKRLLTTAMQAALLDTRGGRRMA